MRRTINWNSQIRVEIKESEDIGMIIDLFDRNNEQLLKTIPILYEDM